MKLFKESLDLALPLVIFCYNYLNQQNLDKNYEEIEKSFKEI